jgi:hypothetical protein
MRADRSGPPAEVLIFAVFGCAFALVGALSLTGTLARSDSNQVQRQKQKQTMVDMRHLATAIEAYGVDMNFYPNAACPGGVFTVPVKAGNLNSSSWTLLTPTYIAQPIYSDGWGHALFYKTDAALRNYELASLGRNNTPDSFHCGTTTTFNDDIIFVDGAFIQWPEGPQQ